ncbi:MAG: ATP-binding protein [Leptolyngbyaceae cyanobacterium]
MAPLTDLTYRVLTDTYSTVAKGIQSGMQNPQVSPIDNLDSPLIFSLDHQGILLSVDWPSARHYGVDLAQYIGRSLHQLIVAPCELNLEPLLTGGPSSLPLEAIWTLQFETCRLTGPVSLSHVKTTASNYQLIGAVQVCQVARNSTGPAPWCQGYRWQLTQLTWEIRQTLDLETIWQQTVEGMSAIFNLEWCGFCSYTLHATDVTVIAEVVGEHGQARCGETLTLSEYPNFQEAIRTKRPVISTLPIDEVVTPENLLVAATSHHKQPNGLILLQAAAGTRWDNLDSQLFQEVVEQVGTAIAHAHLFCDAQGLTDELQAANQRLRQKHRELEDARRQAEEASRLKSEFLANTSHELRTPLNGMIGFLKLILDGMADDPEEQQEFLHEAHRSAIHLLNLINDVLDIAKIEAGKMQIDMTQVKLRELFLDVENFTRPQAEQKGLTFDLDLPPTRDEIMVYGNYQRLLQVILNLVGNAIKFTHEGSITISAEIKSQKANFQGQEWPGVVKVSVKDTGIGVSLEKQDRLFQTFSQVDGERTRQYGGTGLGLAISQRLIEAMGGIVQFISMGEGLGSTVTFTVLLYQEPVMVE